MINKGNVSIILATHIVNISPKAKQFGLELLPCLFINLILQLIHLIQDQMDSPGRLEYAAIQRGGGSSRLGQGRSRKVIPIAQADPDSTDVSQVVGETAWEGAVLLDTVRKILVANKNPGQRFFLAGRERAGGRAVQGIPLQRFFTGGRKQRHRQNQIYLFHGFES